MELNNKMYPIDKLKERLKELDSDPDKLLKLVNKHFNSLETPPQIVIDIAKECNLEINETWSIFKQIFGTHTNGIR